MTPGEALEAAGPPADQTPGCADISILLHRESDVIIAAHNFRVWPQGFAFSLLVLQAAPAHRDAKGRGEERPEVGVRRADGAGLWFGQNHTGDGSPQGSPQTVHFVGGWSRDWGSTQTDWWVQPLPEGPTAMATRWRDRNVDPTWHLLDTHRLYLASRRSSRASWAPQ